MYIHDAHALQHLRCSTGHLMVTSVR